MFVISYFFLACALPVSMGEIVKQEKPIVGNFSKLKVSNAINVIVTMDDKESVVVEANEKVMSHIEVKQIGAELSLSIANPPRNWNTCNVNIYIKAKNLEDIDISGASKLTVANVLKTNKLKLDISGASYATMSVNTPIMEAQIVGASKLELTGNAGISAMEVLGASNVKLNGRFEGENMEMKVLGASSLNAHQVKINMINTTISGASKVNFQGIATTCELDLSGASKLYASDLLVTDYNCEISGASSATIWCTRSISVDASGASSVKYKGNPVMKKMEVSGASSVKQSN